MRYLLITLLSILTFNCYAQQGDQMLAFNNVVFSTTDIDNKPEMQNANECSKTPMIIGGIVTGAGVMIVSFYLAQRLAKTSTDRNDYLVIGGLTVASGLIIRVLGKSACNRNKDANTSDIKRVDRRGNGLYLATNGNSVGLRFNF